MQTSESMYGVAFVILQWPVQYGFYSRILHSRNYEMTFDEDAIRKSMKCSKVKKDTIVKFHVLLTSYELVAIDSTVLQSIHWKVLVIDEAHRLKNNQSRVRISLNIWKSS